MVNRSCADRAYFVHLDEVIAHFLRPFFEIDFLQTWAPAAPVNAFTTDAVSLANKRLIAPPAYAPDQIARDGRGSRPDGSSKASPAQLIDLRGTVAAVETCSEHNHIDAIWIGGSFLSSVADKACNDIATKGRLLDIYFSTGRGEFR